MLEENKCTVDRKTIQGLKASDSNLRHLFLFHLFCDSDIYFHKFRNQSSFKKFFARICGVIKNKVSRIRENS